MSQASETLEKPAGIPPNQIRILIQAREEDIKDVATAIREDADRISDTISRNRKNRKIRRKLSEYLNLPYEKLWGEEDRVTGQARP